MNSKPILFVDFDRTICFERYWRSLSPEKNEIVQSFLFGEDKALVKAWMKGAYTAEEVNKLVAQNIDMPYEELWELFVQDCKTMRVSSEVLEKLKELRSKYTVILITDNMDSFTRFTVPALQLDSVFDSITNSFVSKRPKNENQGKVFTEYAKTFDTPITSCFLLDDSVSTCKYLKR